MLKMTAVVDKPSCNNYKVFQKHLSGLLQSCYVNLHVQVYNSIQLNTVYESNIKFALHDKI